MVSNVSMLHSQGLANYPIQDNDILGYILIVTKMSPTFQNKKAKKA